MLNPNEIDRERLAHVLQTIMEEHELNQYELADRLGVSQPSVSAYLNQSKRPGRKTLHRLIDAFDLDRAVLMASPPSPIGNAAAPALDPDDVLLVPRNGVARAARSPGEGFDNSDSLPEEPMTYDPYPRYELQRLVGYGLDQIRSLTVIGDSLAPEIQPNVRVLYIPLQQHRGDGLYVLDVDGAEIVKRVQLFPGGKLKLIPYNTAYEPQELLPLPEADTPNSYRETSSGLTTTVRVIGKVVWYAKPA